MQAGIGTQTHTHTYKTPDFPKYVHSSHPNETLPRLCALLVKSCSKNPAEHFAHRLYVSAERCWHHMCQLYWWMSGLNKVHEPKKGFWSWRSFHTFHMPWPPQTFPLWHFLQTKVRTSVRANNQGFYCERSEPQFGLYQVRMGSDPTQMETVNVGDRWCQVFSTEY